MAEWSNAVDSKSIVRVSVPGVQIPLSPPMFNPARAGFFYAKKPFQASQMLAFNGRDYPLGYLGLLWIFFDISKRAKMFPRACRQKCHIKGIFA